MSGVVVLALRLVMAAAIYAFLGLALWMVWQDIKQEGQKASMRVLPAIRLDVRAQNRVLVSRTFSKPEIILGRNPTCDILINDNTASAQHARLSYHHNQWWVEDLHSTNGTKLNNERVTLPTVLTTDDEIQCGTTKVTVTTGSDIPNTPTRPI